MRVCGSERELRMTKEVGRTTKKGGRKGAAELFSSSTMTDLLKVFFLHPGEEFYQRELSRLTGNPLYPVQRELARLDRAGLVQRERRGNRVYYRAQEENPAFLDLKRFFLKTVALGDRVSEAFAPLVSEVVLAFIFGSVAAGEDKPGSDVDLLVIGKTGLKELSRILGPLKRRFRKRVQSSRIFSRGVQEKGRRRKRIH